MAMSEHAFYDLIEGDALAPSLATQVAKDIGRRIVAGSHAPGSLLADELALAARYRVSRAVVRDAIKLLVGKGLLEVRRGIGTRVRPRDRWTLLDDDVLAWHLSAPADADFLRQLMEIRRVFEPQAAAWAARRATDVAVDGIRDAERAMARETGSVEDFVIADARFHRAILRAANNEFLSSLEGVIHSALLVSIRLTNDDPRDNEASLPSHRAVSDAIVARDSDEAERTMRDLLSEASDRLVGRLDD